MDARTFIVHNEKLLINQTINSVETLLDRSFQTAYDKFRPSFFKTANAGISQLAIFLFLSGLQTVTAQNVFSGETVQWVGRPNGSPNC